MVRMERQSTSTLEEVVTEAPYPGRGCLAFETGDGLVLSYFVTGRSEASKARQFRLGHSGLVDIVDRSGSLTDELRHYTAAVNEGDWRVIGNGDHVQPLATELAGDADPFIAWSKHSYEPDPPIFTPRIWAGWSEPVGVVLGSVRKEEGPGDEAQRLLWSVTSLTTGNGVLVSTYEGTQDHVAVSGRIRLFTGHARTRDDLLEELWSYLPPELCVGAFALRVTDDVSTPPVLVQRTCE